MNETGIPGGSEFKAPNPSESFGATHEQAVAVLNEAARLNGVAETGDMIFPTPYTNNLIKANAGLDVADAAFSPDGSFINKLDIPVARANVEAAQNGAVTVSQEGTGFDTTKRTTEASEYDHLYNPDSTRTYSVEDAAVRTPNAQHPVERQISLVQAEQANIANAQAKPDDFVRSPNSKIQPPPAAQ
jgi:hypothetical protein